MTELPSNKVISDFEVDDIPWQEGRFLFNLWLSKSQNGKLPARSDFEPMELKSVLANIVLIDVEQNPLNLTIRLIGSFISNIIKEDRTGQNIQDNLKRYSWLIENKKPYFLSKIVPEWAPVDYRDYNILALPLAVDGSNVDMAMVLITPYEYE